MSEQATASKLSWYNVIVRARRKDGSIVNILMQYLAQSQAAAEGRAAKMVVDDGDELLSVSGVPTPDNQIPGAPAMPSVVKKMAEGQPVGPEPEAKKEEKPKLSPEQARAIAALVAVPMPYEVTLYIQGKEEAA